MTYVILIYVSHNLDIGEESFDTSLRSRFEVRGAGDKGFNSNATYRIA